MANFVLKRKTYSIEDGHYTGQRNKPSVGKAALVGAGVGSAFGGALGFSANGESSALIGGSLIGAGVGAVSGWLLGLARKSAFNRSVVSRYYSSSDLVEDIRNFFSTDEQDSSVTVTEQAVNGRTVSKSVMTRGKKSIDPEGLRYVVDGDTHKNTFNVLVVGGIAEILLTKPTTRDLRTISSILDEYCGSFKSANYIAEKLKDGSYRVELGLIDNGSEDFIFIQAIRSGYKINILTGRGK